MARFERSRERKSNRGSSDRPPSRNTKGRRDSSDRSPSRDSGGNRTFEDYSRDRKDSRGRSSNGDRPQGRDNRGRRDSGRGPNRYSRDRRDVEMTKVICSSCGVECEVPFKPTTDKPLFCNDCFAKKGKSGSDKRSNRDLEIINEKLEKIMKALKIE